MVWPYAPVGGIIQAGDRHESAARPALPTPDWALPERGRRGYDSDLVEALFKRASESYADLQGQRDGLLGQVQRLSDEITQLRIEQPLVQDALVSAHKTARDVVVQAENQADGSRAQAQREAEQIVDNARSRARDIVAEADRDRAKAEQDVARLKLMARGIREEYKDLVDRALAMLDEHDDEGETLVEMQETLVAAARNAPQS